MPLPPKRLRQLNRKAVMEAKSEITVTRWIGIRPRIKGLGSEDHPPLPTEVCIITPDGKRQKITLETEQDELDYILGHFPTGYRDALPGEDISSVPSHLIIRDDPKDAEKKGRSLKPDQIPSGYIGLQPGDRVGMSLGGLGDLMAYSISRNGQKAGFAVKRLPPFRLKEEREKGHWDKNDDAELLAVLIKESPAIFRDLAERDRAMVKLRETERLRRFVQGDRKACAMRVRSATMGEVFCSETGGYPEGGLEKIFELALASDPVLMALEQKEAGLNKKLEAACKEIPIYQAIKPLIKGAGPAILGSLLAAIQDIGLFETPGKLKAFCGVHVLENGSFPRKHRGEQCNWNPHAKQAFFLLSDQFNRRPGTFWGARLLVNKTEYKTKHPYPVLVAEDGKEYPLIDGSFKKKSDQYVIKVAGESESQPEIKVSGKQKWFNGHLHKMALWKTIQEFAEWLWWKWRTLEGYPTCRLPKIYPPEDEAEIKKQTAAQAAAIQAAPTKATPAAPDSASAAT